MFLATIWPEIYEQDTERRQTLDDAWRVQDSVISSYRAFGYELVELPCDDVEHRVQFVMDSCGFSARTQTSADRSGRVGRVGGTPGRWQR